MRLSDARLGLDNINPKGAPADTATCFDATAVADKGSQEIKYLSYGCSGAKGSNFTIKVNPTPENQKIFEQVQAILEEHEVAYLLPLGIKIIPYAFINDAGTLVSGISVKADAVTIDDSKEVIDF